MGRLFLFVLIWTLVLESVTIALRFGVGLESTRDTAPVLCALTHGLRIHHGYLGALIAIAAPSFRGRWRRYASWALVLGIALLASDLVHHFAVLWPITGSPQFDLMYPLPK